MYSFSKVCKNHIEHIKISAGIGLIVGNVSLLFTLSEYIGIFHVVRSLLISALVGVGIGYCAKWSFTLVANKFEKKLVFAYFAEGILVFIATAIVTFILGENDLMYLLLAGLVALILALTITYIKVKEFRTLNSKLKEFQNEE